MIVTLQTFTSFFPVFKISNIVKPTPPNLSVSELLERGHAHTPSRFKAIRPGVEMQFEKKREKKKKKESLNLHFNDT